MIVTVADTPGTVVWKGPTGKSSTDASPIVLTLDDQNITATSASGQQLYQINQPTTQRLSTDQVNSMIQQGLDINDWKRVNFPTPVEPPGPDAPKYRRLELTTSGALNYVDYTGQILWSSILYTVPQDEIAAVLQRLFG